jgi:hypothetical protein
MPIHRAHLAVLPAVAALLAPATPAPAQQPAGTDIHLFPLALRAGVVELGPPRNLTARPGYDNQPAFTPDGAQLLFTSTRDGQADSYAYDLASGRTTRLTTTAVSEYSPTVAPDGTISVVVVEPDSTQRLWRFPRAGGAASLVLRDVRPVGYHAWADSATVVLFVLGSAGAPATLQVADVAGGRAEVVASAPHRSLQRIPGGRRVSVVLRDADSTRWLAAVDPATRRVERLVRAPDGAGEYDHAWLPDGSALMTAGGALHRWTPGAAAWAPVPAFTAAGLRGPTRLAVAPRGDWLAVVAEEPPGGARE